MLDVFQEYKVSPGIEEGDVVGFSYDHVELNVFCNGKNLDTPLLGIKGTVFPVLYGQIFAFFLQRCGTGTGTVGTVSF
jgi:hypothetical protein